MQKSHKHIFLLIIGTLIVFFGFNSQFFSADDWFHLRISQISSTEEFVNFFRFSETAQQASFYRPIPTQLFFFIFSSLFGLNSAPYYYFVFLSHILLVVLVYRLLRQTLKKKQTTIASIVFTFSHTHFTRLYFLSAFQETVMTIFVVLFLSCFLLEGKKRDWLGLFFYILALMSKETAIIAPLLLVLVWLIREQKPLNIKNLRKTLSKQLRARKNSLIAIISISIIYLILRFGVFSFSHTQSDYHWSWHPKQIISTARWYLIWAIGLPETIVNYMPHMISINPKFFTDFSNKAYAAIALALSSFLLYSTVISNHIIMRLKSKVAQAHNNKVIIPGLIWFFFTLGPLLLLPTHLFALEMTLPMIGFSLLVSSLLITQPKIIRLGFLAIFILLNCNSVLIAKESHYSVVRSQISQKIHWEFSKIMEGDLPDAIIFVNDTQHVTEAWGSSRQIQQALMNDEYFKLIFDQNVPKIIYQDSLKEDQDIEQVIEELHSQHTNLKIYLTSEFVKF